MGKRQKEDCQGLTTLAVPNLEFSLERPLPEHLKDRIIVMFALSHGANINSRFILFTSQKATSANFISYGWCFKVKRKGMLEGRLIDKKWIGRFLWRAHGIKF